MRVIGIPPTERWINIQKQMKNQAISLKAWVPVISTLSPDRLVISCGQSGPVCHPARAKGPTVVLSLVDDKLSVSGRKNKSPNKPEKSLEAPSFSLPFESQR